MVDNFETMKEQGNLHSNMVKFKFRRLRMETAFEFIYIPIWLNSNIECVYSCISVFVFTFQYG